MPGLENCTTIYLARHGETEWNLHGRFQGRRDSALTARGLEQAEQLAMELSAQPLDAVFASDLGRTLRTAVIVATRHGLPVQAHPGLREIDVGEWSGLERGEVAARWPTEFENWRSRPASVRIPGGETFREVQQRALAGLEELLSPLPGTRVAVITHGALLETVLAHAMGLDLSALWLRLAQHCQAYTLEYAGGRLHVAESREKREA